MSHLLARVAPLVLPALVLLAGLAVHAPRRADAAPSNVMVSVVEYEQGGTKLEGLLATDSTWEGGPRPAVLVVHDWMGVGPFVRGVIERLAQLGYVAFAADVYGKGVRPMDSSEAGALATKYKSDRALMRARVRAALDRLEKEPLVDRKRVAVMGYCFGGTVALECARSGAPVAGVVSFHGGLATPTPEDAKAIRGPVLALHGADDPFVKPEEVAAFEQEMRAAHVDWQLVEYGNAVHAFTNPAAGNDNSKGMAYNPAADRRSWEAMKDFFAEIFQR